ncbi:MAG: hypothetical protein ACR2K0_01140 [Acidimicrobiales bacterium]
MTTHLEHTTTEGPAGGRLGPVEPRRRRLPPGRIVVIGLALAALAAVLVFSGDSGDGDGTTPGAADEAPRSLADLPEGYVTYRDAETGFTLHHPETWIQTIRPQESQRLVLNAGGDNGVLVRVQETEQPIVTTEDLEQIRPVTDGIAASAAGVEVLATDSVTVNDMPGFFYLSRFTNEETGKSGVNAHYFLFQGRKMNIILFQAVPEDEFERLAPEFDKVLASFRSDPTQPAE